MADAGLGPAIEPSPGAVLPNDPFEWIRRLLQSMGNGAQSPTLGLSAPSQADASRQRTLLDAPVAADLPPPPPSPPLPPGPGRTLAPQTPGALASIMELLKSLGNGAAPIPGTGELTGMPTPAAPQLVQPDAGMPAKVPPNLPIPGVDPTYAGPPTGTGVQPGLSTAIPGLAEHTSAAPLFAGIQPGLSSPMVPGGTASPAAAAAGGASDWMKALGAIQAPAQAPPQHISSPPPPRYIPPPAGELLKILLGTGVTGDPLLLSKLLPRG